MTDANFAKPQAFETKNHPGEYSPAPVPEFHQQTRDPGYANSVGPDGDDGGQEWATSTAADGRFTADESDDESSKSDSGSGKSGGVSTASGGTRSKAASTSSK